MWGSNVFVIGGVGRSGTTILGKIIGSFQNVEYFYEPPVLSYLFGVIYRYDSEEWSRLFRLNAYNDLLKNAIAGRNINLNPNDDSYILNYKSEEEIQQKHAKSFRQKEIVELAAQKTLAFKILENIKNVRQVRQTEPNLKALIIIRNPSDTLSSLNNKGWFSDKDLDLNSPDPARNYRTFKGYRVYDFVDDGDEQLWIDLDEKERYAYYYQKSFEKFSDLVDDQNTWFLSYDRMLDSPKESVEAILANCGFSRGAKTSQIIESLRSKNVKQEDVISKIGNNQQNNIRDLFHFLYKRAINT